MKALIQRVLSAHVAIDEAIVGAIDSGLMVLLAVEKNDSLESVEKIAYKILNYRVFSDSNGKMNLSLKDIQGDVLVVSQFTLAAATDKGMRPSFSTAAEPVLAKQYYEHCVSLLKQQLKAVETGVFAADMQVSLVNDGPVTFMLTA